MSRAVRYTLLWIAVVALATLSIRCIYLYKFSGNLGLVAGYPDETNYYLPAAQMIRESLSGFFFSPRSLWNGPLNPLWLAALGGDVAVAKFANVALFSIASSVLAGAVGYRFGWRKGAMVALGLILYPPTYDLVPTVLTEPLYVSLLCFSLAWLLFCDFSPRSFVFSGLVFGLATLVRPTSQMFAPMIIVVGVLLWRSLWGRRLMLHGLCAFAVCVPTMTWNFVQYGKAGLANGLGAVLYLGGDLRRDGDEPVYAGVDFDTYRITTPYTHLDTEGDARLVAVAKERMLRHPVETAELFTRKAFRYLFGSPRGYFWPFDGLVAKIQHEPGFRGKLFAFLWPALHVLVVCGALVSLRRRDIPFALRLYVGALTLYFVALHMVTFPIPRMVFPLYPYLLVLAVVGLCTKGSGQKRRIAVAVVAPIICALIAAPRKIEFATEVDGEFINVFESRFSGSYEGGHDIQEGRVTGDDPYQLFRFDRLPLLRSQMVSFAIAVACPEDKTRKGSGQVFWRTDGESFTEAKSVVFPMRSVSSSHIVPSALSSLWTGQLTGLRIDLPPEFKGCSVSINESQILD